MPDNDLLARCCDTVKEYLALGNESFEAHGAAFVRNRATPGRYDSNHVGLVRTSEADEIEALLARIDREFDAIPQRRVDIDPLTPAAFEARLALEHGYQFWGTYLALVLEGDLRAAARPQDIRPVLTETDWQAYAGLTLLNWRENDEMHNRPTNAAELPEYLLYKRAKAPADRTWLAYADGVAVGFFSSWPGTNSVGQAEDLFVLKEYRHRSIATALVSHCIADCRARGAEAVVICADPSDTPKHMYAAMGLRPIFAGRSYLKRLPAAGKT